MKGHKLEERQIKVLSYKDILTEAKVLVCTSHR